MTVANSFASICIMNISNYIEKHSTQSEFAKIIGVTSGMVYQWQKGLRPISAEQCVVIEQKTEGKITRKDLRPNDWHLIWPELEAA